jgi:hypothetical protein
MKKHLSGLLAILTALACTTASAGVINFDDLPGDGTTPVANGYAGFNWTNFGTISSTVGSTVYPGSGYAAGVVSPDNAAFNWNGDTAAISTADNAAFDYIGAWFTSAYVDQEISFEGSRNGDLLYASGAFTLDTLNPQWIRLDWSGIDTLTIYNSSGTQWAVDEVTVPEPATLGLFGIVLAGMGATRRRARQPAPSPARP